MKNATYVVCGCKSWNKRVFDQHMAELPGKWHYIGSKEKLTLKQLKAWQPRYIFFLHWSWIVPDEILRNFECINFHMTDLPYGRGGSPLQNLILRGHKKTKLSAFRMTSTLDAGPMYGKKPLSLAGTAQEILERSSVLAAEMIKHIAAVQPQPKEQKGKVVLFERRKPAQSEIPDGLTLKQLYDFIRMLDGEGYPPAFRKCGCFRYEYTNAVLYDGRLEAHTRIVPL
ncbi:MAG: formyltransferase family protein [Candidatus Peribacteraceae bacterium]|nr:formyltransferase family protein [Candidatus Peribacteraceae bacterium]